MVRGHCLIRRAQLHAEWGGLRFIFPFLQNMRITEQDAVGLEFGSRATARGGRYALLAGLARSKLRLRAFAVSV